jgi:hypothetical protein
MLVSVNHTIQHHIPEDYYLNIHHCENLKSHSIQYHINWTIQRIPKVSSCIIMQLYERANRELQYLHSFSSFQ